MSNVERVVDQVIRDANDIIARSRRHLREKSLVRLLDGLDHTKLPPIWKREPITRRRPAR